MLSLVLLQVVSSPQNRMSWVEIIGILLFTVLIVYLHLKLMKFVFGTIRSPKKPEVRYVFTRFESKGNW